MKGLGPNSSKKDLTHSSMLKFNGVKKVKKNPIGKENQIDFNAKSSKFGED